MKNFMNTSQLVDQAQLISEYNAPLRTYIPDHYQL